MLKSRQISWSAVILEVISVVFAILLALVIDQWRENQANSRLAAKAVKNIVGEISNNKKNLEEGLPDHRRLLKQLENLDNKSMDQQRMAVEGFRHVTLNNTAWNTAVITQAVSHMDFETVSSISEIYDLQDLYGKLVEAFVMRFMYETEIEEDQRLSQAIREIRGFLTNILKFEEALLISFNDCLEKRNGT